MPRTSCPSVTALLVTIVVCLAPGTVAAQGQPGAPPDPATTGIRPANFTFRVSPATGAMQVDARLDEPAWQQAEVIPLPIEISPRDNVAADVETHCRVTFDTVNLYLGCEAFDPDPSSIRAYITNRDRIIGNQDRISFLVDPFNDSRRGFVFEVSAVGVQADLSYDEQTDFDASWDGIWTSAGRITERGYVIEAAIPFQTLRFPASTDVQTWRFWINRMRPRSEFVIMRTNTRLRGESCELCQAHLLEGFTGMQPGLNVELVPTLTGRQSSSRASTFPDGPLSSGAVKMEPGLDGRWSITPNMSLNATVNPDFSQVEADAPQLDANNAFALRFTEKRPFFLEGADLFRTPIEAVFTRSITDPIGGAKLTGKTGPHALGLLTAVDESNAILIPGPFGSRATTVDERVSSTFLRYRRDLGANNTIGALYTGRFSSGDYRNQVAGADFFVQPTSSLTLSGQALASETQYDAQTAADFEQPSGVFSGRALSARLNYRGRAWFVDAGHDVRSDGFRADAGFVPQTGYRGSNVFMGYDLRGSGPGYTLIQPSLGAARLVDENGDLVSQGVGASLFYEGPGQSNGWLNPEWRRDVFDGVTHGLYRFWFGFNVRPRSWLRVGINSMVGDEIDFRNGGEGDVVRVTPTFDAQIGRQVEIGSRHSFQRLEKGGVLVFNARVDEIRGIYNFSARSFVRATLQYRRTEREPSTNPGLTRPMEESLFSQFLFSYKVNPLTVLFLGLTDDRAGFDELSRESIALTPRGVTLFFKLGYAWRP